MKKLLFFLLVSLSAFAQTVPNPYNPKPGTVTPGSIGAEPSITAGTTGQYWRGDKSWQLLNAASVGLGNTRNVASYSQNEVDAAKPDLVPVTTFVLAQTQVVASKPKIFIITNDETYGSSVTIWNGSSWSVLPGIPRSTN